MNETGLPLPFAYWPVRAKNGERCVMQPFRGEGVIEQSLGDVLVTGQGDTLSLEDTIVEAGKLRRPEKHGWNDAAKHEEGWIFVDLALPPRTPSSRPYLVHLQLYLRLSTTGSALVAVEKGEVVEVRYVLTPDVAELRNVVDDSTREGGSWFAPSKVIVLSSWVGVEGITLSLIMNKEARYHEYYLHDEDDLPLHHPRPTLFASLHLTNPNTPLGTTSCFLHVKSGKEVLLERAMKINPLDGSTQAILCVCLVFLSLDCVFSRSIGNGVVSTVDPPAVFREDHSLTISFGFFDSGIARSKQMYVYASRKLSKWLGDLISVDERELDVPFEKLAVAGSHDCGMLGRLNPELLAFLDLGSGDEIPAVARALPLVRFLLGLLSTFAVPGHRIRLKILSNFAMTQKDSIESQLNMGVRFFDFRPGYSIFDIVDEMKGEIRHQYSIVPGVGYEIFLIDILAFLSDNTSEIVVVELKSDGFPFTTDLCDESDSPKRTAISMVPTVDALAAALQNAKSSSPLAGREIKVGSRRSENFYGTTGGSHDAYDTDDPLKVLAALNVAYDDATSRAARKVSPSSMVYQLQATPTAQIWADIGASLTYSDASSLLVWSKARMDRVTYPWLASKAFIEPGFVVFLNDFVDGCLVEHALEKTKERIHLFLLRREAASSVAPTLSSSSSRASSLRNSIGSVAPMASLCKRKEGERRGSSS
ncbi:hypothetical protein JCM1841_000853 [Sporobolomyces salmonicolor]